MTFKQWALVVWIALSCLVVFVRGAVGGTRHYTMLDAWGAVIECGIAIWFVVTL